MKTGRLLIGLAIALGLFALLASDPATADPPAEPRDPPVAEGEASKDADKQGDDAGGTWTQDEFEDRLSSKKAALTTSLIFKFGPLVIGFVLLVLLYLRMDKIKGGVIPAPPKVEPTLPVNGGEAMFLCLAAFLIIPLAFGPFIIPEGKNAPMRKMFILLSLQMLPVAFLIVFRRIRLARPLPPKFGKGTLLGAGAFCIAAAVVLPIAIVWALALVELGKPPQVQGLVQKMLEPDRMEDPYLIAVYGVIIAPFAEESIFRGMLYPLGRKLLGGTRQGAIGSAVATSALFAAIHQSLTALVPLFVLALVLTWVFEKTNSLTAVVVAHALNNFTSLLPLLLYHWT